MLPVRRVGNLPSADFHCLDAGHGDKGFVCIMLGLLLFWERYLVVRLYEARREAGSAE